MTKKNFFDMSDEEKRVARKKIWDHVQNVKKAIADNVDLYILDAERKPHRVRHVRGGDDFGVEIVKTEHGFCVSVEQNRIYLTIEEALKE
jgi:hypothetical protein